MIVRVKFRTVRNFGDEVLLFGNSYKNWKEQFEEAIRYYAAGFTEIVSVEKSRSKWIEWGGLKWCSEEHFQSELNREGCQANEPDNSNPRQYANMRFVESPNDFRYATAYFNKIKARNW